MSFLFDALKPQAKVQKPDEKPQEKTVIKEEKLPVQAEEQISIGYPAPADEREMVIGRQNGNPMARVQQVMTRQELISLRRQAGEVYIHPEIVDYIVALINATREHPLILRGASPRATLTVASMAKAAAWLQGRDYVVSKDIQTVFSHTVCHRLLLGTGADAAKTSGERIVQAILHDTAAPRLR